MEQTSLWLHLLTNSVRLDLMPVHFRANHRQLSSQRFERIVRHGCVVLLHSLLIFPFLILNCLNYILSCLLNIARYLYFHVALFLREQLNISILVVVNLNLDFPDELLATSLTITYWDFPLATPASITEILGLELMRLNAHGDSSVTNEHTSTPDLE